MALNVSVSSQMLSLSTIVPDTYRNTTSGLLGNYNNKPSDDFTLPNGTTLNANMTEREIFSYGKLCKCVHLGRKLRICHTGVFKL